MQTLNSEQEIVAEAVTTALDRYPDHSTLGKKTSNVFFIDGHGGTGKTYLSTT